MDSPQPLPTLLDYTGKTVIVTGGGSGLGRGIALRFAEAGAQILVHYHSSAAGAQAVVDRCIQAGSRATAAAADLTNEAMVARLVGQAADEFGRIDVLINNAGIYPVARLLEMTPRQWDEIIEINLRSVFLCTRAAARQMVAQGMGGAIVNLTSIEAESAAPDHSHYAAAKAGVLAHTRAAAWELGSHGIRVNAVAPGLIWREGIEQDWPEGVARWRRTAPLGRLGQPEDVADACLFLASPAARWITGTSLTVDGGAMTRPAF